MWCLLTLFADQRGVLYLTIGHQRHGHAESDFFVMLSLDAYRCGVLHTCSSATDVMGMLLQSLVQTSCIVSLCCCSCLLIPLMFATSPTDTYIQISVSMMCVANQQVQDISLLSYTSAVLHPLRLTAPASYTPVVLRTFYIACVFHPCCLTPPCVLHCLRLTPLLSYIPSVFHPCRLTPLRLTPPASYTHAFQVCAMITHSNASVHVCLIGFIS